MILQPKSLVPGLLFLFLAGIVAVTALTRLGIPLDPAWELDGRSVGLR